jgi:spore germination cell wall hydrolase CwlJ-like protein
MTKLFDKTGRFPYLTWLGAGVFGAIVAFITFMVLPDPKPTVVKVPVVQVIEKPVVVKKPVYMSRHDRQQIQCLAENAYFEAGNQSTKGKIAVTNVVMNRVADKRFPKTPCGVVHQKSRGVCQFSWVCQGRKRIHDAEMFAVAKKVAEDVYLRNVGDVTMGAKFYHANYVNPGWNLRRVTRIGAHIFYKG